MSVRWSRFPSSAPSGWSFGSSHWGRALAAKRRLGYDALDVLKRHLASDDFFVGGRYTVADIALYAYTHVAHEGGFDLAGYPTVRA